MVLQQPRVLVLYLCLTLIGVVSSLDFLLEFAELEQSEVTLHLGIEILLMLLASSAILYLFMLGKAEQCASEHLRSELSDTSDKLDQISHRLEDQKRNFIKLINEQLQNWNLTGCEQEVALLVLKGFNFEEIAEMRGTSCRTARKQAASIYKKAGVKNRNEFAAWFFEDLL